MRMLSRLMVVISFRNQFPHGRPQDGEMPVVQAHVLPFAIDRYAVTNSQYLAFIEDVGYTTDAEQIGWSFVFAGLLPDDFEDTRGVQGSPWWRQVFGASWKFLRGRNHQLRKEWTTQSLIFHGTMQLLMQTGLVDVSQLKLSGSSPHKEV